MQVSELQGGTLGQPKHVPVIGLFLANQLAMEESDTLKEEELCVPADVVLPASS